jgi:hypothetical protein
MKKRLYILFIILLLSTDIEVIHNLVTWIANIILETALQLKMDSCKYKCLNNRC